MTKKTFDLSSVQVSNGEFQFTVPAGVTVDGTVFAENEHAGTIATKNGILYAADGHLYDFQALTGGEFEFKAADSSASVRSFDGSGVASAINVTVGGANKATESLATVTTGAGKDSVTVSEVTNGVIDLGAGNDIISFTAAASKVTVGLGAGADLVSVDSNNGVSVSVSDYNYADNDKITVSGGSLKDFDYEKGQASIVGGSAEVLATTALNNGVYELNLNNSVYVRTNVSSVEYAATQAIDFASNADTTTLNLTLAGKNADKNTVSVGAAEGTVNIFAGKAQASITVARGVDFGLGIEKNGSVVSITSALGADDTLYLMDGGKISDVDFENNTTAIKYGKASVAGAYNNTAEGTFKYNINGEEGVLAYGGSKKVTYADGVTYYANADTVDASEYEGDVVLNLNGVCGDAFANKVSVVSGVVSGLVAGRNKVNTIVFAATEAGKKTEIYGGVAGNDSINLSGVDSDSTNIIWYSNGDGNDTVSDFTNGDNTVYFHDAAAAAGVLNDVASMVGANGANLKIAMDKKNALTLNGVKAATDKTNIVNFKDVVGNTFKVAVGDGTNVTYNSEVNIYKGATTLKVDGKEDKIIWTGASNDEYGYYDDIKAIDASEASGTLYLSGTNENGMTIAGGTGVNHMWGGGNKIQTLVANDDAVNVFWFGASDGRDTAKNADGEDGVNLYNVENINDVAIKASTNYFTVTVGNDSLKVDLATGTTAEEALKTFTFADKAGALYTYDTESKKFQQK